MAFVSLLLYCSSVIFSENTANRYDYLADKMVELNIQPKITPPSKCMIFLRKFSIIPLVFYKAYRYLRTKMYILGAYLRRKRAVHS